MGSHIKAEYFFYVKIFQEIAANVNRMQTWSFRSKVSDLTFTFFLRRFET